MKFIARGLDTHFFSTGGVTVSFDCSMRAKEELQGITDGEYWISIEKVTKKRTSGQNALLWKLVGEINQTLNGRRTTEDDMEIYRQILEMAGTCVEQLACVPDALPFLESIFRVVKVIDRDGDTVIVKVYKGTSQMNTSEMSEVIEQALYYAEEVGIDTDSWRREFNDTGE